MTFSLVSIGAIVITIITSFFLLVKDRSRDVVSLFFLLILSSSLLAFESYILDHTDQFSLKRYVFALEGCLPVAAIAYSVLFCRQPGIGKLSVASRILIPSTILFALFSFWLKPEQLIFSPDFGGEKIIFLTNAGFLFYVLLMMFLVLSMVQLERTLSALSQHERWRFKFEIIALCVLLGSYVVYYSQSLLYRSLDMGLLDARSFALIMTLALLFYSRNYRSRGEKVYISRGVAYRSLILFVVGVYLIGLGIFGEGMKYLDWPAQKTFLLVLVMVGTVVVSILFLSESLRRKVKVYLHKNFYQSKYDYRHHWQVFTDRIFSAKSFDDLQREILIFYCEAFACNGGAFYLYDDELDEYLNTSHFEFRRDWRPFVVSDPLVQLLRQREWIINLSEANDEFEDSLVESLIEAGATFVVPLFFDKQLEGFIVLFGQINTGEILTYEDYDFMKMLARQSIAAVQGIRLTEKLSTTREMAAIGKVSTFVLHDLKNQVSGLSLMLDNAREYIDNPEFQQDMLETVDSTVVNMRGLIARLKNLKEKPELIVAPVDLKKVVQDAVNTAGGNINVTGTAVRIDADEEEIYRVILNLLINAIEATAGNVPVIVDFGCKNGFAYVNVSDSGCGMSKEFIDSRLFKPFETTKKHGFGIGLYQCRQIMDSHQGLISVDSKEGEGTTFSLQLPLAPEIT